MSADRSRPRLASVRILSVADLHYALKQWDWVRQAAPGFDVLILPGDMLDIVSAVGVDVQIVVVRKYLARFPEDIPVLISSGNHDGNTRSDSGESVAAWLQEDLPQRMYVDGDCYLQDAILFTICPWWDGEDTKAEIARLLSRDAVKEKQQWIWIYHAPPSGSPLAWDGKHEYGDDFLSGWIDQYRPDMVLGGHIHHAPFARGGAWHDRIGETLVFNAGKQIGPVPAYIEFDTADGTATWHSLAGVERLDLRSGEVAILG